MKVGIAAPLSLASVNGGVRTQVLQTAHHLRLLNVDLEFIQFNQEHFNYDLIHVFAASTETIGIAHQIKSNGIKLVVSPVFYSNRNSSIISLSLFIERIASFVGQGIRSDFGIKSEICRNADMILPNTLSELKLVRDGLKVNRDKLQNIPNGVESRFRSATPDHFINTYGLKDFVLFVGQAGAPRKNVIQLLKSASNINSQIVIIGDFYDDTYSRTCLEMAESAHNVLLLNSMQHNDPLLESAYAACKVFCLPSLYETPGIAALEAALAGANIVITKHGGTKEYFKDLALYVDPNSTQNISTNVNNSLHKNYSDHLYKRIMENYTWEMVAQKLRNIRTFTLTIIKEIDKIILNELCLLFLGAFLLSSDIASISLL